MKYLQLLAKEYKNSQEVTSELLNLSTILTLPKGTEFFFSDLHGEYEAFLHLLRSASGVIKNKIDLLYKDELTDIERQALAHLIYYPRQQMETIDTNDEWYETQIYRLIHVAKFCSSKYTRSKVNKKLPKEYAYVITEMLNCHNDDYIQSYYHDIIQAIIDIHNAQSFIIALCRFIRDICIDWIHVIGDIYDRGPRPDLIMNELMKYNQVDIQWGNHDISWMGAACGNTALIANVLRIALSYNHFDLLEDGYGINLRALSDFAREYYADDPCLSFMPHTLDENQYDIVEQKLAAKMHKAITIIQMKLEGQMIQRHPEYEMNDLIWLNQINYQERTVSYLGHTYTLKNESFPTIDPQDPLRLSKEEETLMKTIQSSFEHSEKLHKHIQFLYTNGNIYKKVNGNLLFHGCIPMDDNGQLRKVNLNDKELSGQALMDALEDIANKAYFLRKDEYVDRMWYLWCSKNSPVFGKSKLCVFEKYFIEETDIQKEIFDPYYTYIEQEEVACSLLKHFGLDEKKGHIINGHVPVKVGENPVKSNGKLLVIDGGISKAYQPKTGIAGYTLIFDSQHLQLARHDPYNSEAKEGLLCLTPHVEIIETATRIKNRDCDIGETLRSQRKDLLKLLQAYKEGTIKEKR